MSRQSQITGDSVGGVVIKRSTIHSLLNELEQRGLIELGVADTRRGPHTIPINPRRAGPIARLGIYV